MGSVTSAKTIGIVRVSRWRATVAAVPFVDVGLQADQLLRKRSHAIVITAMPPKVHPHVAAVAPTQVRKSLSERRVAKLTLRVVFVAPHQHADAPDVVALLRPRHHRPRRRANKPRDERSALH